MAGMAESFGGLSAGKKIGYVLMLAVAISAIAVFSMWAGQPQYQLLYANLSDEETDAVIEQLQKKNIPYKVGGGGTISVPKENVYETRLELAASGAVKGGGVGFEIFDRTGFGSTEFVQKVNYLRATQGELARTISGLSEVETARVHIVVPEMRLFQSDEVEARASVVLKLMGGRKLRSDQIQGVVNLVAGSVSGLSTENITVLDATGRLLTIAMGEDGQAVLSSSQLEYRRSIEKELEARIRSILGPVVGVDKVKASVSTDINFQQVEKTEERFDPDSVVVRNEQMSKEKVGGAPRVSSNQKESTNYEISKIVSRTVEPTGVITRLSIAVLVDGTYDVTVASEGAEETRTYVARTEEELKKFEDLIKGAVGFVSERGDSIKVVNIPFEARVPIVEFEAVEESMLQGYMPSIIRYGTIMVLALIVLFFVIRPLIAGIFAAAPTMVPLPVEEEGLTPSPVTKKKKSVKEIVESSPEQSAQVVKRWLRGKGDEE